MRRAPPWAWLVGLLLPHALALAHDPLPATVQDALRRTGLPAESLAAVALPLSGWVPSWQYQGQRAMQPGSTMKLLTSVVALDRLGPNLRGHTELLSAAPLQAGTLQGDLVLKGGGDAELGLPQLWALLVELQQAGVRHIAGDLVLDRTRYSPARFDQGLPPFDEAPEFPYNVIPDALHLAGGLLPLELRATDTGVVASTVPPLDGVDIDSRMTLVDARCQDWDDHWKPATVTAPAAVSASAAGATGAAAAAGAAGVAGIGRTRITLNGAFPRGCTTRAELQLLDRTELAERAFRSLWRGLGGSWAGRAREAAAPPGARLLARRLARPWGELLRHLNKTSDNAWTRLLYLELGVPGPAESPDTPTRERADRSVRQWLAGQRIPDAGLVLDNGSGLSRSERITPWQLARVLQVAHGGPHAAELHMSLPTAGVDGGLRNRLKDSPATGWARLKTGSLRNVVALAGYVRDPEGRWWAVSMMINHDTLASQGRPVLDALVEHLARFGPHPVRAVPGPQGEGP